KQRKTVSTGATTDYASNFVYENNTLQFFNQPEGYVEPTSDVNKPFQYVYQYKDHLGNIRLSYKDISTASTPILQIQEENNYYPFGLKHKGYNNVQVGRDHKFGFGNKEEQDELGLAWIDITARNYDATLGRWMNVDPLADERPWESPYAYCGNDPINRIDEDGEFWVQLGGAILSAGIDYAGQVAGNLATGQGMRSALTSNISIGSILVSATEGAINPIGGVSKATTKSFAITIAKTTIKEAGKSGAGQVIDNIIDIAQGKDTKISNGVVREAVVGGIVGNAKIAPNSPKANKTIIELNIKQDKGKTLTKRQTERLVDAKTEKSSNDIVNGTMNYVGTANQKAVSNVIKEGNEKKD
ncbi:MAG: RHS repeat-associated core domain-containing protein, partial [Bacteroidetes bacterium]|nr:RHS repeat-associated core domain-containing protein [Bacteroidota bacterium]